VFFVDFSILQVSVDLGSLRAFLYSSLGHLPGSGNRPLFTHKNSSSVPIDLVQRTPRVSFSETSRRSVFLASRSFGIAPSRSLSWARDTFRGLISNAIVRSLARSYAMLAPVTAFRGEFLVSVLVCVGRCDVSLPG